MHRRGAISTSRILNISNSDKLSFRLIQKPSLFPQFETMNSIIYFYYNTQSYYSSIPTSMALYYYGFYNNIIIIQILATFLMCLLPESDILP